MKQTHSVSTQERSNQTGIGVFGVLSAVFLVLLMGISAAFFNQFLMNHDVAYFLVQSIRMVGGDRLYVDIIDFNPPMIHFFGILPALISRATGWPIAIVFYSYVFLALVGSAALCLPMTRMIYPQLPNTHRTFLVLSISFCLFLPALEHFGQREHLFLAFFFPYMLLSFARSNGSFPGKLPSLLAGILAAIALCFKPYFAIPFVAVELFAFLHNRALYTLRRWDIAGLICIVAVYLITILVAFPGYYNCIRLARLLYTGYDTTTIQLIDRPEVYWYAAILLTFWIFRAPSVRDRSLYRMLVAVMGAFLLMALVQRKGWDYQYYPLLALEVFFACLVLVRQLQHWGLFNTQRCGTPGVLLLALSGITLSLAAYFFGPGSIRWKGVMPKGCLLRSVMEYAKGRTMYVLSTSLYPGWTMVLHSGARWPYRHPSLWFLPQVYKSRTDTAAGTPVYNAPGLMGDNERLFYSQVVDDLIKHPPALLMIDKGGFKQGLSMKFDFEAYFRQDDSFSRLFGKYRRVATVAAFDLYAPREPAGMEEFSP